MIYVKRTAPPPRLDLTDPGSPAAVELQRAKDHLRDTNVPLAADQFKAYADAEVREALATMFKNKCAYCESQIAGSSQTDIEHYRPKGRVDKNDDHPGYWWLAMDWSNLVLSCMHCNQSRRQLILSPDLSEEEIRKAIIDNDLTTTGKKNQFPTENNIWTTDPDTGIDTEQPLLFDPTVTNPEPLLDWSQVSDFAYVMPKGDNRRADVTIKALGLNRTRLCQERMTKYSLLLIVRDSIRENHIKLEAELPANEEAQVRSTLETLLKLMSAMGEAKQPHAALARHVLAVTMAQME